MTKDETFQKYKKLFLDLKIVVLESEKRTVCDPPDDLFIGNVNFFVKSYLISICTYLEAMLQDLALIQAKEINNRLLSANIPHNYMVWKMSENIKEKHLEYKAGNLVTTKEEISEDLSAHPYRTIKLFQKLGLNLNENKKFTDKKDLIASVVTKRNKIVHHNDRAADVSFSDVVFYIENFIEYSQSIKDCME